MKEFLILFLFTVLHLSNGATKYFVSLQGDDTNPGTLDRPWKTIQKAVSMLQPGDTCVIREGTYTEEVSISSLQGAPGNPVTFTSYPGEIVLFDGTMAISQSWKKYRNNIYYTTLEKDIWQLFVDGQMQVNARWPNAFWKDFSVFDYTKWGFSSAKSTLDIASATGVMVDNGTQDLANSGLNVTGAIAILNIGSWLTWAGMVDRHDPGSNSFGYHLEVELPKAVDFHSAKSRYYLEDLLDFLDAPTEWFYDKENKQLYLWTLDGDSPENHEIRGKISTYAFSVTQGSAWLVFSDLSFFGTTVYMMGQSAEEDVHNITLQSLHFTYPSYTKRMLRSLAPSNTTTIFHHGPMRKYAGNFTIFNCTWEYADGQTISYRGAEGTIHNNLWHHNDFSCVNKGMLFQSEGVRDNFFRNVVHSNGPCEGFLPGQGYALDKELGLPFGSTVQLNLFYDLKSLQNDGSHVQTNPGAQNNTILEYNWSHSTLKWGLRFDCGTCNDTSSSWGHNGTMRYNVLWKTRGASIKGDNQSIHNNLIYDSTLYADLFLRCFPGDKDGFKGENKHTMSIDNIIQHGACPARATSKCTLPVPGEFKNNLQGDVHLYLRDPENFDFRPKANSDLISQGVGPYGKESMSHGGTYWIPGRQELVASIPIPPNATTNARCDADLMWLAGYQAQAHSVYFGTNKTEVATANASSLTFKGRLDVPANIVTPGKLKPYITYFWRVDTNAENYIKKGDIWMFQCM